MEPINIPTIELLKIEDIKSDGENPNRMTAENFSALKKVIKKYGFTVPIITNKDKVLADGEHRLKAAKELGMKEIPTIVLPVKDVDRRMLRQIMNKLKGSHDKDKDWLEYQKIYGEGMFEEFRELLPAGNTLILTIHTTG